MTEKKKLPGQRPAHNYWAVTEKDPSPFGNDDNSRATKRGRPQQNQAERRRHQQVRRPERESIGRSVSLQRVVTVPRSDPSYAGNAFVERQRQRRERAQQRSNSYGQTQYVARTLAQTGIRASSGRLPAVHRPLPSQKSPVPARSGRQKPKPNHFWSFLIFLIIVAIILLVINFLLTSDAFRIAQVRVVGTRNDALIQRVQAMGARGQNIFLLDVPGVITKLNAQPEVETADLSKQWPNQLVVSIKERIPVLLWQKGQSTFSVDSQGMVIAPASNTVGANALSTVIDMSQQPSTGTAGMALRPGMWINKTDVAFAAAILKQLPQIIGEPASSYKLYYNGTMYTSPNQIWGKGTDSGGSYTIENLVDGWRAYLGGAGDLNPLSNRLLELLSILDLARQEQLKVATIDLRYGLHPVFTLQ